MIIKKWKAPPKNGDIKENKEFLWLPTRIKGDLRWLELITYIYRYHNGHWYIEKIKLS